MFYVYEYQFSTYREAEIFCGEHGIHGEEIYEVEEEEEVAFPPVPKTHRHPFDCWV